MTVFEPTTPHRDRLAKAFRNDYSRPVAYALADALIEADVVADPEYVAWLAEQVTRVKAVEGLIREGQKKEAALAGALSAALDRAERAEAAVAEGLALADESEQGREFWHEGVAWVTTESLRAVLAGVTDNEGDKHG